MLAALGQIGWLGVNHMAGWGGGWMWIWMGLFWLVVVALVVWAVTRIASASGGRQRSSAEDVLAERFARGEIDADEYRERLRTLRG